MFRYYIGTPGSGKSYHMASDIYRDLQQKKGVISTVKIDTYLISLKDRDAKRYITDNAVFELVSKLFYINEKNDIVRNDIELPFKSKEIKKAYRKLIKDDSKIKSILNQEINEFTSMFNYKKNGKKLGKFTYVDYEDITYPNYFYDYAEKNHVHGINSQTCIYIDEGYKLFDPRAWNVKGRKEWNIFTSIHRHHGFDICLTSQNDNQIDNLILSNVEFCVKHRQIANFGMFGKFLCLFVKTTLFAYITTWYNCRKQKLGADIVSYDPKIGGIYDSWVLL